MTDKNLNKQLKTNPIKIRPVRIPIVDAKGNVKDYKIEYTNRLNLFAKRNAQIKIQKDQNYPPYTLL